MGQTGDPKNIQHTLLWIPLGVLCLLMPQRGEIWSFDPGVWGTPLGNSRGIACGSDGTAERIFYGTANDRLYSIDAKNARSDEEFGEGGFVDLLKGLIHRTQR